MDMEKFVLLEQQMLKQFRLFKLFRKFSILNLKTITSDGLVSKNNNINQSFANIFGVNVADKGQISTAQLIELMKQRGLLNA